MVRLIGIPRTIKRGLARIFAGTVGDVLWKLFVLTLVVVLGIGLLSMGAVGGLIGGLLLASLIADDVRALVGDLWHRRWASIESPF